MHMLNDVKINVLHSIDHVAHTQNKRKLETLNLSRCYLGYHNVPNGFIDHGRVLWESLSQELLRDPAHRQVRDG